MYFFFGGGGAFRALIEIAPQNNTKISQSSKQPTSRPYHSRPQQSICATVRDGQHSSRGSINSTVVNINSSRYRLVAAPILHGAPQIASARYRAQWHSISSMLPYHLVGALADLPTPCWRVPCRGFSALWPRPCVLNLNLAAVHACTQPLPFATPLVQKQNLGATA